ncbi:cobalt ABC transporter [archaeon SCG-AAA382B04]|nr:cobalt ABC transporter [archaeon SCG-AAA382B04]
MSLFYYINRRNRVANNYLIGKNLSYSYPDGSIGIKNVDVCFERGERIAILGANGSGKSTLLMVLGGLLSPDEGEVIFKGESDLDKKRSEIGVFVQDPDDFLFNPTVEKELRYETNQLDEKFDDRFNKYVEKLSLNNYLDKPPFRLSEGEKKRVMLASLLIPNPSLFLLDEAFSSLDPFYKEKFIKLLNEQNDLEKTIISATQNLSLVPRIADKVILLGKNGELIKSGEVREILYNTNLLKKNNLEAPQVVRIAKEVGVGKEKPVSVEELIELI